MQQSVKYTSALPDDFKVLAIESLGVEVAEVLFTQIEEGNSYTSVRANLGKGGDLSGYFGDITGERVKWCDSAFYLKERPQFTLDPIFHAGGYYVQEASSMYVDIVRESISGIDSEFFDSSLRVLDLCAAPGGKSTHLLANINSNSFLVANEVIKSRAVVLADNIAKWGFQNVIVTNNDPKDFSKLDEMFNLIVVDAPCSGEGLFRKDSDAIGEWSPANVKLCAERQRRILDDVWSALMPGGFLVYSTCTYNHFENDDNLKYILEELGGEKVDLVIPPDSGIIRTSGGGLQFVPGFVKGEGQFVALVRKSGDYFQRLSKIGKKEGLVKGAAGELMKMYPAVLAEDIRFFEKKLRCVLSGVAVATVKGKDLIPHADLALSNALSGVVGEKLSGLKWSTVEVDRVDALKFLAKEPLVFSNEPMGYLLLVYNGYALGFVKNLGNRSNNLLPMARRIRMSIY